MTNGAHIPDGEATDWSVPQPTTSAFQRWRLRRVPYFERPKPPHDWRWVVGGIGRTLIVTGLMMFAFVGYQLWGTGIETARAQNRLENEFNDQLETTSTSSSVTPTTPTTDSGGTVPATTVPVAPEHTFANGDPVARLSIPKIGLYDKYVVEGVRMDDLKNGPGHFKETPMPGQLGNAAIAGHRTTWGHPFLDLDQLDPGDRITLVTLYGTYVYEVTFIEIVAPAAYGRVIPTTDFEHATLVLATCHPAYTSRERLIVFATIVLEESDPLMRPASFQEADPGAGLPGDSPPVDTGPVDTGPDSTGPETTGQVTETTTVTTSVDTVPPTVPTGQDDGSGQSADTFAQGWFDDTDAIPHVIGWGLVLLTITVGSYYAGKAARRLYVCFLVGALPFVFVLYFFFQNVNRFLPPGL
ncbi:MAG: class E sortase [Actinomycetota bacterium]|nr:class E sortase [Actinomycetota bacterium]